MSLLWGYDPDSSQEDLVLSEGRALAWGGSSGGYDKLPWDMASAGDSGLPDNYQPVESAWYIPGP
ncbi:MAG TPA: hypothetical protein VEX11_11485, partial [Acetobacteraceae bacterium]|nr:hypothetical protein [Acetobacteraceae bacterium]